MPATYPIDPPDFADPVEDALRETFGLSEFRHGQREIIDAVLSGRPTVAVMPTGAGKSLCYQLPAVVAGGTALVVSPLIALMKDQVDALSARGIPACAITSALNWRDLTDRIAEVAAGKMRLVYVAPERFRSARFIDALDAVAGRLSLLAIDEAHCISEWGHDFRPDYMRLHEVVRRFRPPRLVALTATATPEVRRDIVRQLDLTDAAVFVRGFDRPNLRFIVERTGGPKAKAERLNTLIRSRRPALVYAATRNNAEELALNLCRAGVHAAPYHAGLDDDVRAKTQERFMDGRLDVIVATNAFGMGIDKTDVRLVAHADLPRSPEAYYQEAGRAGRDGLPAECVLLFNHADVKLQEFLIEGSAPSVELLRSLWKAVRTDPRCGVSPGALRRVLPTGTSEMAITSATRFLLKTGHLRQGDDGVEAVHPADGGAAPMKIDPQALAARADVERSKLKSMVAYAYASSCRRRYLLTYFGDADVATNVCAGCDVCSQTGARELTDAEQATMRVALRAIRYLGGRFGRGRIAALLVGDDDDQRLADMPERGALRRQGAPYVKDLLRSLEAAGLVEVAAGEYPTLAITKRGRQVVDGVEKASLVLPQARGVGQKKSKKASKAAPEAAPAGDPEVVDRLRAWRRKTADDEGVPAYRVFSDKTLQAIASARPKNSDALAHVDGIGPARLERYGREILAIVR